MPLDDAVVFNDTVYGMMGPYILKLDGSTGALISSARVIAPMLGPCRITSLGAFLYVGTWNNPSLPNATSVGTLRGFYPVNPTTLAVGTLIDWQSIFAQTTIPFGGPRGILGMGSYIYAISATTTTCSLNCINPTNIADKSSFTITFTGSLDWEPQSLTTDGTNVYVGIVDRVVQVTGKLYNDDVTTVPIRAVAWSPVNSRVYGVTGSSALLWKVEFPSPGSVTSFNLAAIQANVLPFRIRYNALDGLLYIPCQNQNCVIIWNPASDTGTVQTGFDSPIDCVFTSTKKWAVCNGITPLQAIT